ncbi:MAG: serine/threonine protein kinase [Anaerolineaceae bacterium]|nr:serine/threonine protein kinase [Anaerolineaceae bacterium]
MGVNYCYACMARIDEGQVICPYCGHNNSSITNDEDILPEGTILNGKYLVGKVIGRGGFGVTYLGIDLRYDDKVAIKEYFPNALSNRQGYTKHVKIPNQTGIPEKFQKGMTAFEQEAWTLSMFKSPSIVGVRRYFTENNTGYIVMDYIGGIGFNEEIQHCGGHMPWQRVMSLMLPLMPELNRLHEKNLIHRDIKPENIKIVRDANGSERLVLLDFGNARGYTSSDLTKTYSQILTPGFAPYEQYLVRTHQGPYTDIYSLCATMYVAITGHKPPAAPDRLMNDTLQPFSSYGLNVPPNIERAIFHGLDNHYQNRQQNLYELYRELTDFNYSPAQSIPQQKNRNEPRMENSVSAAPMNAEEHYTEYSNDSRYADSSGDYGNQEPDPYMTGIGYEIESDLSDYNDYYSQEDYYDPYYYQDHTEDKGNNTGGLPTWFIILVILIIVFLCVIIYLYLV